MSIKMALRFHPSRIRRLSSIKQTATNVGKDAGKKEILYTYGGSVN
jgi:hypothetical protein